MNFSKKQSKRDFLISSARKMVLGGLGLVGLSLGYRTLTADQETSCEVNLPCRNCFNLGHCGEEKAVQKRKEIKESRNGTTNGKE